MPEFTQRPHTIKAAGKRGPGRLREDDGTRILSVKFREPEYARLKRISLETRVPMKELLRRAVIQVYGEPREHDAVVIKRNLPAPEVQVIPYVYTSDTRCSVQEPPAKPKKAERNTVAEELFKI